MRSLRYRRRREAVERLDRTIVTRWLVNPSEGSGTAGWGRIGTETE